MGEEKNNPFPVLKTERLILRQLENNDANEIYALRSNDQVNKYLERKPSESIDDAKVFIQAIHKNIQNNHSFYWAINLNGSDKLVGTICLFDFSADNLKAEIGYELLPDFQGKGIMQEAFAKVIDFGIQDLRLDSIEATTHRENKKSIALLEKFNFKNKINIGSNFTKYALQIKKE
ncbi:MAG: N-acetyltransferase [Pedobacter sp.]|nr:MAG: N-acetyltransferase [Pedobacter sp.]